MVTRLEAHLAILTDADQSVSLEASAPRDSRRVDQAGKTCGWGPGDVVVRRKRGKGSLCK